MTERCTIHRWELQTPRTPPSRKNEGVRVWRCRDCDARAETPISRMHEIRYRHRVKPGPMPDQQTIYDVLDMGTEAHR